MKQGINGKETEHKFSSFGYGLRRMKEKHFKNCFSGRYREWY
jgi:hypothetical protein